MFGQATFYDRYGNFDNKKFLTLLEKAKKAKEKNLKGSSFQNKEITLFNSVGKKELWQFVNKLAIFLNSGIDIKSALAILIKQTKNPYMQKIVTEIRQNIDHGISISETMENYPKVFDNLTISLINVGEKTGQLGLILDELDTTLLENIELKGKVKGAMIYPIILLSLTIMMVVFMMIFIIPKITESFDKAGTDLPGLTQFVVGVSDFLIEKWYILIAVIFIFVFIMKLINTTYYGKIFFAGLFTKLPIFGYIVKQSNVVYFIKSFYTFTKFLSSTSGSYENC
ncbi:MAG: type II secretion system F family protein [Candidatus Gracilibacteria bacterium]|nr:type II secretion system F family protein [Candidatus Gracilibacteria bacterium]